MVDEICSTVYFEKASRRNTDETFKLAKERAEKLGIESIVVASSTGATGVKASEVFKGFNLVMVTQVTGFEEPNLQGLLPENRAILEKRGVKIVTAAHAFGTLGRAVNRRFNTIQIDEIIANVLRLFGDGVKVACEITCMAADAGFIKVDSAVIGIGGTGGGADTAIVIKPSNTHKFFEMRIREIICKPRLTPNPKLSKKQSTTF